jgi:hypothetical protein
MLKNLPELLLIKLDKLRSASTVCFGIRIFQEACFHKCQAKSYIILRVIELFEFVFDLLSVSILISFYCDFNQAYQFCLLFVCFLNKWINVESLLFLFIVSHCYNFTILEPSIFWTEYLYQIVIELCCVKIKFPF